MAEIYKMTTTSSSPIVDAKETFDIIKEISRLLNTGLDSETLMICVRLCENGVNPEALANVIKELKKETAVLKANEKNHT